MKITVIGGGYVGLTTGICLSYVGHNVNIVEKDHAKFSAHCRERPCKVQCT